MNYIDIYFIKLKNVEIHSSSDVSYFLNHILHFYNLKYSDIYYTIKGKPYLHKSNLKISISHSKSDFCIAISDKYDIGIDIEHIRNINPNIVMNMIEYSDLIYLKDLEKKYFFDTFYSIWCLREAYFKISGKMKNNNYIKTNNFFLIWKKEKSLKCALCFPKTNYLLNEKIKITFKIV